MAAERRVIDYMRGLPQTHQHREMYFEQFMDNYNNSALQEVDGVEVEKGLISHGEREIIKHLNLQEKFTKKNFHEQFDLAGMISIGKDRTVKRTQRSRLDFQGSKEWWLYPASARALYSTKESTINLMDDQQKRQIMSQCPTLSGGEAGSPLMASIHERLSIPTDLRHLFTKMILYLNDYTLAVTSKCDKMGQAEGMGFKLFGNIDEGGRLSSIVKHDIVLDATLFTEEQLSLLCLAGEQYPSIWYAGEGNIYNSVNMEADDLVVVSDHTIRFDNTFSWGSPDRLYNMIWEIACKLNAIGCLTYALESTRGKCKMMSDMIEKTECYEVNSMIPRSYCVSTSFGATRPRQVIAKMPGFFSTSLSLVTDLLYGMTFKAVASCVSETLGSMGKVVSSATPLSNPTINGIMRDYGLQHTNSEMNFMLRNFEMVSHKPTRWDYGQYMKEYALRLAQDVHMGSDIEMPSILLCVPALTAVHTSFGLSRGWYGEGDVLSLSKRERMESADALSAIGWMCKMRNVRPQVFRNRLGKKQIQVGSSERQLQAEAKGDCRIRDIEYWVEDSLGGRVDEIEESGGGLYRTEYSGTKCTLVFNYEMGMWVEAKPQDYSRFKRETFTGQLTEEERRTMSKTEPTPVAWHGGKKPDPGIKTEANLNHMKSVGKGHAIRPSINPKFTDVGGVGEPEVPKYVADGEERVDYIPYKKPEVKEGEEITYSEIDVPGDGSCGIHAVVKDLTTNGRLHKSDASRAYAIFDSDMASKRFHDAAELAAQCQEWGMGMDLIDRSSSSLIRYGDPEADYRVSLVREGNHFKACRIGEGENRLKVSRLEEQIAVPEEFVQNVRSLGSLFGGKPIY